MWLLRVLGIVSLLLFLGLAPASAQTLSFNPLLSDTLDCGETFTVNLEISAEITDLRAFSLVVTYDGSRLAPVSTAGHYASAGNLVSGAGCSNLLFDEVRSGASSDTLQVDVALLGCSVDGAGSLVTLQFESLQSGASVRTSGIEIAYGPTSLRDSGNQEIPFFAGAAATVYSHCNHAPDAVDDTGAGYTTDEDTPFTLVNVLANDSDPDPTDTISFTGHDGTGVLGILSTHFNGVFDYTPPADFNGTETFTYFITDNDKADTATVTITVNPVNDPPVAKDDAVSTLEDNGTTFDVLADNGNGPDTDIDDAIDPATTTVVPLSGPASGSLLNNGDGTFNYTPDPDFSGFDSFQYTVDDASGDTSNQATVTITVIPVNDPPVAQDDSVSTPEDVPIEIAVFDDNGHGPDADPDGTLVPGTVTVVSPAGSGMTSVNTSNGHITYTPDLNTSGTDSFTYTVNDNSGATSNEATVTVTVTPVDDPPQVENPGNQSNVEQDVVSLQIVASDIDSGTLEYLADGLPGGLAIDANDGLISGQILCGEAAGSPFSVLVGVTDGTDTTTVGFDWTVTPSPPPPVTDLAASQVTTGNDADGTTGISVSWTRTLSPGETVRVYRKGFGAYPEYDDGGGAVPAVPADTADAVASGWTLAGVTTASSLADEPSTRDVWYYVAVVVSPCGESSLAATSTGVLDYHLGDFTDGTTLPNPGDNQLDFNDVGLLGNYYGTAVVAATNVLDIGPTTGGYVDTRPATDNLIDFEDLVLFSINFGMVSSPAVGEPGAGTRNALTLTVPTAPAPGKELAVDLDLEADGSLQAVSVPLVWNEDVVTFVGIEPGDLAAGRNGSLLVLSPRPGTVDAAALGSPPAGRGRLASVTFRVIGAGDPGIRVEGSEARDARNRSLPVAVEEVRDTGPIPARTRLLPPAPNPFRAGTVVTFDLAAESPVRVLVFGIDGRRVRNLVDRTLAPGTYRYDWDGRNEQGQAVAAGMYLIRFQAGNAEATNRVVRLR